MIENKIKVRHGATTVTILLCNPTNSCLLFNCERSWPVFNPPRPGSRQNKEHFGQNPFF